MVARKCVADRLRGVLGEQTSFAPKNDLEKEIFRSCVCPKCPSFPRDALGSESTYCRVGQTAAEPALSGCLCPSCPVYGRMKMIGWYFCSTGRAEIAGQQSTVPSPESEKPVSAVARSAENANKDGMKPAMKL